MRRSKLGPDHPDTLTSQNNLASAYYSSPGMLERAIPLYERTLEARRSKLGPDHPHTLTSQNNLANAYKLAGKLDRAIPLYERTMEAEEEEARPRGSCHSGRPEQSRQRLLLEPGNAGAGDPALRADAGGAEVQAGPGPPPHPHQPEQPGQCLQTRR